MTIWVWRSIWTKLRGGEDHFKILLGSFKIFKYLGTLFKIFKSLGTPDGEWQGLRGSYPGGSFGWVVGVPGGGGGKVLPLWVTKLELTVLGATMAEEATQVKEDEYCQLLLPQTHLCCLSWSFSGGRRRSMFNWFETTPASAFVAALLTRLGNGKSQIFRPVRWKQWRRVGNAARKLPSRVKSYAPDTQYVYWRTGPALWISLALKGWYLPLTNPEIYIILNPSQSHLIQFKHHIASSIWDGVYLIQGYFWKQVCE